jgi:hypothetical protein
VIELPLLLGALQVSVALVFPAVALVIVGAVGVVAGVTALEGVDAEPVPRELIAATVKV